MWGVYLIKIWNVFAYYWWCDIATHTKVISILWLNFSCAIVANFFCCAHHLNGQGVKTSLMMWGDDLTRHDVKSIKPNCSLSEANQWYAHCVIEFRHNFFLSWKQNISRKGNICKIISNKSIFGSEASKFFWQFQKIGAFSPYKLYKFPHKKRNI